MWPNFRMKNCIYYNLTLIFRIVSHSILKLLLKISHRDNSWIKLLIETEKKWFISIWQTILVILNGGFVSFLRIYSFLIAFLELFCWWKYSLTFYFMNLFYGCWDKICYLHIYRLSELRKKTQWANSFFFEDRLKFY